MKTKILFTINNLDSAGMKYVLASLVIGIDKNIFEPTILVNQKTNSSLEKQLGEICEIIEVKLRNPGMFSFLPTLLKNIKTLNKSANISHSFDYSSDWFEALTMKLSGIKHIVEKTNLSFDSYRWKIKLSLADCIICLSASQFSKLSKYSKKTYVIPTGINVANFEKTTSLKRSDVGLTPEDIVIISVAHLVEVKGYEELISAVAEIKDEYPNLKLICLGNGTPDYEAKLKQLTNSKNVTERFRFIGNTSQITEWLKIADLKILATQNRGRREAFGAAIVEAMAASLPVLATRTGGPEDIVIDGETGWLVNGDGVTSLVNGLRHAIKNRDKWLVMGKNGHQRAKDTYDEKLMVQRYSEIYKSFIPNKAENK